MASVALAPLVVRGVLCQCEERKAELALEWKESSSFCLYHYPTCKTVSALMSYAAAERRWPSQVKQQCVGPCGKAGHENRDAESSPSAFSTPQEQAYMIKAYSVSVACVDNSTASSSGTTKTRKARSESATRRYAERRIRAMAEESEWVAAHWERGSAGRR